MEPMGEASDIMTIDEVATYLRLGRRAVYRLAQSGELPGRKILNRWRFHLKDVEAWVRQGRRATGEYRQPQPGS